MADLKKEKYFLSGYEKWKERHFTCLKFPRFVEYLIWLQMASNISLVVVTKRKSNTFTMESQPEGKK